MRVICISNKPLDSSNPFNDSLKKLELDKIYTVIGEFDYSNGYLLEEVKSSHPNGAYSRDRFKKIDTEWVDELLANIEQGELVNVC